MSEMPMWTAQEHAARGLQQEVDRLRCELTTARQTANELADGWAHTSRERDLQVALYEAAANWFDREEWARFEESEEFRSLDAQALALSKEQS